MNSLILLITFFILSKEDKRCKIISKITEQKGQLANFKDFCVYFDTSVFDKFQEIIIEAFTDRGFFREKILYYEETSEEPTIGSYITLSKTQSYFDSGSHSIDSYSSRVYYHFKKPETTEKYLIVACPEFFGSMGGISIFTEMSSLAISLIVIGCIIFVGIIVVIIIIICLVRRKRRRLFFDNIYNNTTGNDNSFPVGNYYPNVGDISKPINDDNSSSNNYPPINDDLPPPPSTDYPTYKYTPNSSIYANSSVNKK